MFDSLSSRLGTILEGLGRKGTLTEFDVTAALQEVRTALLEADVALPVVRDFIKTVKDQAIGRKVLESVSPGQQVVKIVHDALVEMLSPEALAEDGTTPTDSTDLNLYGEPPVILMMVGLQGSGKTTTTAKLARRLTEKDRKKVLMVSLDVARPAAQEQLKTLGEQVRVNTLPIIAGQPPLDITRRAVQAGRLGGYDVVILDTAGRLHVNEDLMAEAAAVRDIAGPSEILLVADAMTGQDAVTTASAFHEQLGLTGIVLTRVDGDARGGAALSMRQVTRCPIKFMGTGEKTDALEVFHADRIARRILGMGDVVSLVEKAQETLEQDEAQRLAKKIKKGQFDLEDMASQLAQMRKMGGMEGIMGMLPGVGKMKQQMAAANIDDRALKRQEAIISSMTVAERTNPKLIHASRKKRIAAGAGASVQDVNKLLKQHKMMAKMMKQAGKLGEKGMARSLGGMMGGGPMGGGMPRGLMR